VSERTQYGDLVRIAGSHILAANVELEQTAFADAEFVLVSDRDVLPGRHRHRSGDEPGQAGEEQGGPSEAPAADPDDQKAVCDEPVDGPEDDGAELAAGDVAVLMGPAGP